jgi:toxin FitB
MPVATPGADQPSKSWGKFVLLDTNVASETRKAKPHRGAMAWIASVAPGDIAVCAFSFGEMQFGIEFARRQDPAKAMEIESWLNELQASITILDVTAEAFRAWARMMSGRPSELNPFN